MNLSGGPQGFFDRRPVYQENDGKGSRERLEICLLGFGDALMFEEQQIPMRPTDLLLDAS